MKLIQFVDHFPNKKCDFGIHGAVAVVERLPLERGCPCREVSVRVRINSTLFAYA